MNLPRGVVVDVGMRNSNRHSIPGRIGNRLASSYIRRVLLAFRAREDVRVDHRATQLAKPRAENLDGVVELARLTRKCQSLGHVYEGIGIT